jgi:hypothetical protein
MKLKELTEIMPGDSFVIARETDGSHIHTYTVDRWEAFSHTLGEVYKIFRDGRVIAIEPSCECAGIVVTLAFD